MNNIVVVLVTWTLVASLLGPLVAATLFQHPRLPRQRR